MTKFYCGLKFYSLIPEAHLFYIAPYTLLKLFCNKNTMEKNDIKSLIHVLR